MCVSAIHWLVIAEARIVSVRVSFPIVQGVSVTSGARTQLAHVLISWTCTVIRAVVVLAEPRRDETLRGENVVNILSLTCH